MLHSIHRKFTKLPLQTCYPHKVFSVKKGIVSFCVPTCLLQLATAALCTRFAACSPPPAAKSGEKNPAPADPYPDCRKHPERCRNNMPSRPHALTFGTKTGPQGKVFLNFLCFIVFLLIFAKRFSRYPGNLPARPDLLSRKKTALRADWWWQQTYFIRGHPQDGLAAGSAATRCVCPKFPPADLVSRRVHRTNRIGTGRFIRRARFRARFLFSAIAAHLPLI